MWSQQRRRLDARNLIGAARTQTPANCAGKLTDFFVVAVGGGSKQKLTIACFVYENLGATNIAQMPKWYNFQPKDTSLRLVERLRL